MITMLSVVIISTICGGYYSQAQASDDQVNTWLYLRSGQSLSPAENPLTLIVVGDMMLGRSIRPSPDTLAGVTSEIRAANLALGNFEGVLAPPGGDPAKLSSNDPGKPYKLVMDRKVPVLLQEAGFDLVSLANNHALDLNPRGLVDTVQSLQDADIQVFGLSHHPGLPTEPLIIDKLGYRLAFLAFTMIPTPSQPKSGPVPALYDPISSATKVAEARQSADVVVVLLHGGVEYQRQASQAQEKAARNLAQAGADLVLGQHPHVIQGTEIITYHSLAEKYRTSFIAYSLGNFVFDQFKDNTRFGMALRIYLDSQGLRAVQALPLQAGSQPRWLDHLQAQEILDRIRPPAGLPVSIKTQGFSCTRSECIPRSSLPGAVSGRFQFGRIDLTGDGRPEEINLSSGKVEIFEEENLVWSSPDAWQVLDLALGDPNDDGRFELFISLRKKDRAGQLRSHPFIVGYRNGMYKLLWGGSELSTPIDEVELGDIDGDGTEELIVLEQQPGGETTLSVWRWHGWGFILSWRSTPAYFENLRLSNHGSEIGAQIQVELRQ
jgi:poly-gamma-glutamate synthesis protein (capsule biosynthesis protein)